MAPLVRSVALYIHTYIHIRIAAARYIWGVHEELKIGGLGYTVMNQGILFKC